jgi:multimeric flavodoxin WrbA
MMAKAVVDGVKEVRGIEVELLKAGTLFSISKLNEADALIVGSPSHYGSVTKELKAILESMKTLQKTNKLSLSGKIGGVFTSYAWDGGWLSEKLKSDMKALGIQVVEPAISAIDKIGGSISHRRKLNAIKRSRIDEKILQKCHQLGKKIAMNFAIT